MLRCRGTCRSSRHNADFTRAAMVGMSKWVQERSPATCGGPIACIRCRSTRPKSPSSPGSSAASRCRRRPESKEEMLGRPVFVRECAAAARRTSSTSSCVPDGPLSPRPRGARAGRARLAAAQCERLLRVGEVPGRRRRSGASRPAPASARSCRSCARPIRGAKFGRIVLVHAVRHANELAYRDVIGRIARDHPRRVHAHSDGEPRSHPGALGGTDSRRDSTTGGSSRARALPLAAENSHAMLCGNPAMVDDHAAGARRSAACDGTAGRETGGTSRSKRTGERSPPADRAGRLHVPDGARAQPPADFRVSSTSNSSVALGGMTPPAPRSP